MNDKKNIAILSDSPFLCTGYSNQSLKLGNLLVEEGHNILYFASNYLGQNLEPPITIEGNQQINFKVIGQGREQYFKDLLPIYTKQYKIDILIILLDTFMLHGNDAWLLKLDLSPAKTIFWFPSDGGGGLPLGCEQILKFVNVPIAMSKFGQQQCKEVHNLNTLYIPHAINTKDFYKLDVDKRLELRKKWNLENKFVIGTVARNQGRKMLDRTIKVMAKYSKLNPNAVLLMHCDPTDVAQVFPIVELIKRYNIENRVIFTGTTYYKGIDYKDMNEIYNLMDVFLLTTSGEGFGIPTVEAMSCQVPVLVTNYTTTKELVIDNNAGLGIDVVGEITGSWVVERGLCDIDDAVTKIDYLYKNINIRNDMGKNGRIAVLEKYSWEKIGEEWKKVIKELGDVY